MENRIPAHISIGGNLAPTLINVFYDPMENRIPAHISIGGNLAATLINVFYDTVADEGVGFEWGESICSLQQFLEVLHHGTVLDLYHVDAAFGQLENLESFCREYGLIYVSDCQGDLEHHAEVRWWAPGMLEPGETLGTQDGRPAILIEDLRSTLQGANSDRDKIAAVEALLDRLSPPSSTMNARRTRLGRGSMDNHSRNHPLRG
ncbi:MAG TPA: hypothetical protein VLK84_02705 [Longimicrobium sp.]|nr:hypothetical protein [Longimicrobium sp.]